MARKIKRSYFNIAKSLGYLAVMPDIKEKIYSAETERDIAHIMATARHLMIKEGR